jgi:transcriptional regulator with XRE-family HTH domain
VNIYSSLIAELRDKEYRDSYVASQIRIGLPFQVRALRLSKQLTQGELAERAEMTQPRIAEIEKAGKRSFNLETLLRIASALDVGLEVRFVPISEIIDHDESFDPDNFSIPTFEQELRRAEVQDSLESLRAEILQRIQNTAAQMENARKTEFQKRDVRSKLDRILQGNLRLVKPNKNFNPSRDGSGAQKQIPQASAA